MVSNSNVVIYTDESNNVKIDVLLENENVWLSQKKIAELFDKDVKTINKHILNIYAEKELQEEATGLFFEIVQHEGNRDIKRDIAFYNLEMIIAIGYRVNSNKAIAFRQWATKVLKEYKKNIKQKL